MSDTKVIRNEWRRVDRGLQVARILERNACPEGLDVERLRFTGATSVVLDGDGGHIVSVIGGTARIRSDAGLEPEFRMVPGRHAYLPPGGRWRIVAYPRTEVVHVAAPAAQARGERLLVRDERFLQVSARADGYLRWVLTPQYLSRRVFLHHDPTLLSPSGEPISWYRTTMFDVEGLPPNEDGRPVFKMSYDSHTEFNVCYDVQGDAFVRMAVHPYRARGQAWGPWQRLDGDATYHLDEAQGGPEEETWLDPASGMPRTSRNKHEVEIIQGHVTLLCSLDPAPTGFEQHRPGEYSDYEPIETVKASERYAEFRSDLDRMDPMLDGLSRVAVWEPGALQRQKAWRLYQEGRRVQLEREAALLAVLRHAGQGREMVVGRWAISATTTVRRSLARSMTRADVHQPT